MTEIPRSMKAVRCHGPQDYRLEQVPVPGVGPGEALIRVEATGVCASDLKCFHGADLFWGDEYREGYCETPVIPGHEFVGRVVSLGEGAKETWDLSIGERVIAEQILPCWNCRFCGKGQYWMCQRHHVFGFKHDAQGAMAEYMKFPAGAIVHSVPDQLDPRLGALIEPLSCSIHAVERGEIRLGDTVVICGCGTLGLGMVGAARLKSPGCLIALDTRPDRLKRAEAMGADVTIQVGKEDPIEKVLEMTQGYGCDVYIEASGHPSGVVQGLHMVRRLGTFVEFSVFGEPVTVDWTIVGDTKELNIHGAHLGPYCYPLAMKYLSEGTIDGSVLLTHEFSLDRHGEAFRAVHDAKDCLKVLLIP